MRVRVRPVDLPLEAIHIRQRRRYERAVRDVEHDPASYEDDLYEFPVEVSLERGVHYLERGHHRYVTALLLGWPSIRAQVYWAPSEARTGYLRRSVRPYQSRRYVRAQDEPAGSDQGEASEVKGPAATKVIKDGMGAVVSDVARILKQANIQAGTDAGSLEFWSGDDGIAVGVKLEGRGLTGALLVFDFTLNWFGSRFLDAIRGKVQTTEALQGISLKFCNTNFYAGKDTEQKAFLQTIAVLQASRFVSGAGEYANVPDITEDEEGKMDWLLQQILGWQHDRPDVKIDWTNQGAVLQQIQKDDEKKFITPQVYEAMMDAMHAFSAAEWKTAVQEMDEGVAQRESYKPSTQAIEALVKAVTKHENYTGKFKIENDPRGNYMAILLDTPYPFRIVADWDPGTGVKFQAAHLLLCKNTYEVDTIADAKKLLTAMVDLTIAYHAATNAPKDMAKAPRTVDETVVAIQNRALADPEKWLAGVAENPEPEAAKLKEFEEAVQQDPDKLVGALEKDPEKGRAFFEHYPDAMTWLKDTYPDIGTKVHTMLFGEQPMRAEVPGFG